MIDDLQGKKYLLRLINTSVDTAFSFSIDGHSLTVIGADFVPVEPYDTRSVLIGISRFELWLSFSPYILS